MKNIETPNNNPFLGGLIFLLLIFTAVLLFAAAMMFADTPSGLGQGGGVGVFGAGVGDGTGIGEGSGSQDGSDNGSGYTEGTNGEDASEAGDNSGTSQAAEEKNNADEGEKTPESPVVESEKKQSGKKDGRGGGKIAGEKIFIGKDDSIRKNTPQSDDSPATGKPSFSSGGRSVFQVKKNENVLFVVDVSGSMSSLTSEQIPRIEVLKLQLKAILSLQRKNNSSGKYGILAFSDDTTYFPAAGTQMRFNSKTDLEKSGKWIDQLDKLPRGGTRIFDALEKSLAMARNKAMSIDSIYLLTDGDPTDIRDVNAYISLIKKSLPKKVKIHTISIGIDSNLLREIAKHGNGRYDQYQ